MHGDDLIFVPIGFFFCVREDPLRNHVPGPEWYALLFPLPQDMLLRSQFPNLGIILTLRFLRRVFPYFFLKISPPNH